jgi:molybdopterin synthase catalytic subunit
VIVLLGHCGVHKKGTFKLEDMLNSVKQHPNYNKVGAVAFFIGTVRGESLRGETVKALELEAYDEKADETLENICKDLKAKKGIVDVQIHHFTGKFDLGEDLVYVLVAGGHRKDVFTVLEEAVERYKKEAPIFKKEYVKDVKGKMKSYWVSEREGTRSKRRKG